MGRLQAANVSATLTKERADVAAAAAAAARAMANANGAAVQRRAPDQDDAAVRRAVFTAKVAQALKQVRCWSVFARMTMSWVLPDAAASPPM